ncbi:MAG TPA: type II toxin-antitoxin system RatA family toxin [Beijerinckiaceae bacterium]|jgi:coenzyme Q-binding protein COQ10
MPSFRTTRLVGHAPERMFDLVADVERYPEFLPLCEELKVLRREADGEGTESLVARMSVGYKAISESFTSKVRLYRPNLIIDVAYVDGPFRRLDNRWTFRPQESGCAIDFAIDYEFRSVALGLLMGSMFDKAFRKFTQAFEERADRVYGRPTRASA